MDANDVIKTMMGCSGTTKRELSRAMGRSDNYIATTLARSQSHSFELVCEVAETLGYTVEIAGHGAKIAVTGPESDLAGLAVDDVNTGSLLG